MADPATRLQSLVEVTLAPDPLPPSEVRRLGDRRRRRRAAGVVLAAAACVAAVAVGVSVVDGPTGTSAPPAGDPSPTLDPSPTPRGDGLVPPDDGPESPGVTPSPQDPGGRDISASFPLAAGLPDEASAEPGPDYGITGPNRKLRPLDITACGVVATDSSVRDRMRVEWLNPEDWRTRQLTTYDDADAAVAAVADMVGVYRGCPAEQVGEDGFRGRHAVQRTGLGGESWVLADYSRYQGSPAVGLSVTHVVRLGRAVLIISEYGEGMATGPRDPRIREWADQMAADAAEPLAAMCAFTEAGC